MQSIFNSISSFSDTFSLSKSSLDSDNRRTYEVKFADTEESISSANKITVKQLKEYNDLPVDSTHIKFRPGELLFVSEKPNSPKNKSPSSKNNSTPPKSYFSSFFSSSRDSYDGDDGNISAFSKNDKNVERKLRKSNKSNKHHDLYNNKKNGSDSNSTKSCANISLNLSFAEPEFLGLPEPIDDQDQSADQKLVALSRPVLLSKGRAVMLRSHLPLYLQMEPWRLLYSLYDHGSDMSQFFRRAAGYRITLLFVQTSCGSVFGGLASDEWRPRNSYYGSGTCFLYRFHPNKDNKSRELDPNNTVYHDDSNDMVRDDSIGEGNNTSRPITKREEEEKEKNNYEERLEVYPWTTLNEYCLWCTPEKVAMGGGGGGFGFVLDSDFRTGSTATCATFNNPPLVGNHSNVNDSTPTPTPTDDIDVTPTATVIDSGVGIDCMVSPTEVSASKLQSFDIINVELWTLDSPANHSFT